MRKNTKFKKGKEVGNERVNGWLVNHEMKRPCLVAGQLHGYSDLEFTTSYDFLKRVSHGC